MDDVALRALSNRQRREILRLVWSEERSSREIAEHFDTTWQAVSQNLRVLTDAGLLRSRKEGRSRYYKADHAGVGPLRAALRQMWDADLDRLAGLAEAEAEAESRRRR